MKKPGTPDANAARQYDPGVGGQSKAGVPGQPGNKSGPAADKSGGSSAGTAREGSDTGVSGAGTAGSDNAKVPGAPGFHPPMITIREPVATHRR